MKQLLRFEQGWILQALLMSGIFLLPAYALCGLAAGNLFMLWWGRFMFMRGQRLTDQPVFVVILCAAYGLRSEEVHFHMIGRAKVVTH